jgi:hypothetical protein
MNTPNPLPARFADISFDKLKGAQFAQYAAKYVYIYLACIFLVTVVFIAYTDKNAATTNYYYYLAFLVLPILLIFYIISPLFTGTISTEKSIIVGLWGLAIFISTFIFFKNRSSSNVSLANQALKLVFILGAIVGLSIIYKIFARSINNMKGWVGFFIQFLFYLPCLLLDFVEYVLGDLASTPRVVLVLFVLEMLVILAYYYVPILFSKLNGIDQKYQVLKEPIFINTETVIADNNRLLIDATRKDIPKDGDTTKKIYSRNYSIIAWINIVPHPQNNEAYSRETNILRYGEHNSNFGKPAIVYHGSNSKDNKKNMDNNILIYLTNEGDRDKSKIEIELKGQKWNQIAIVYNDNTASVYVNGEMEKMKTLDSKSLPSFAESDLLIAGSGTERNPNGLHGAICNVSYYDIPLTKEKIATMYNLYSLKNPPF